VVEQGRIDGVGVVEQDETFRIDWAAGGVGVSRGKLSRLGVVEQDETFRTDYSCPPLGQRLSA
jgi:hypothetical protein